MNPFQYANGVITFLFSYKVLTATIYGLLAALEVYVLIWNLIYNLVFILNLDTLITTGRPPKICYSAMGENK